MVRRGVLHPARPIIDGGAENAAPDESQTRIEAAILMARVDGGTTLGAEF